MEMRTSVFERKSRLKKTKQLDSDGNPKMVKVRGGWVYRIHYLDQDGIARCMERGGFSLKSRAKDEMNVEVRKLSASQGNSRTGDRITFDALADRCEAEFYKKPVYSADGRQKIAGVKSHDRVVSQIRNLRGYFGKRLINTITTQNLFAYREERMKPKPPKTPDGLPIHIKIATVNRELAAMRRMMRFAHSQGWIARDIFYNAKVIEVAREESRNRILSLDEEKRLLAACEGTWTVPYSRTRKGKEEKLNATFTLDNKHLRAMIILAIDTGMRRGEIVKLRWSDIDMIAGIIRIDSTHTKTSQQRYVPLSARARAELEAIRGNASEKPFPYADVKRSFATAKRLAGIEDLHFHDLRATAGDRMAKIYPLSTVAKILGHSQLQTTMKHYVGNEIETVLEVKGWLDRRERSEPMNQPAMVVEGIN